MKKKLKTFHIPINITISGHETVQAKDFEDAIRKAKKYYSKVDKDNRYHGLVSPSIEVDFPQCEEDVEIDE